MEFEGRLSALCHSSLLFSTQSVETDASGPGGWQQLDGNNNHQKADNETRIARFALSAGHQ